MTCFVELSNCYWCIFFLKLFKTQNSRGPLISCQWHFRTIAFNWATISIERRPTKWQLIIHWRSSWDSWVRKILQKKHFNRLYSIIDTTCARIYFNKHEQTDTITIVIYSFFGIILSLFKFILNLLKMLSKRNCSMIMACNCCDATFSKYHQNENLFAICARWTNAENHSEISIFINHCWEDNK